MASEIELRSPGLHSKSMYPLIQLTGPSVAFSKIDYFDFEMLRAISEIVGISVLT